MRLFEPVWYLHNWQRDRRTRYSTSLLMVHHRCGNSASPLIIRQICRRAELLRLRSGQAVLQAPGKLCRGYVLADGLNAELLADFSGQVVIQFHVPGHGRFLAVGWILVNRVAASFVIQLTAALFQMAQQVAAFHLLVEEGRIAPAATERGINSTKSASESAAVADGGGSGRPSSR